MHRIKWQAITFLHLETVTILKQSPCAYMHTVCAAIICLKTSLRVDRFTREQVSVAYCVIINLLKSSPTVKKGAALFKVTSVKKVVKSKGVNKKWLWWYISWLYRLILNFNHNNSGQFVLPHPSFTSLRISKNFPWIVLLLLKNLPSIYIITAIALISQFFHTGSFEQGHTFFLQLGCFWVDITI